MAKQSLIITIIAHVPYIRNEAEKLPVDPNDIFRENIEEKPPEKILVEQELLFSAISETYLPLLKIFKRLKGDNVPFRLVMVFSPTLCSLLADPAVQTQYSDWLDRLVTFGERELARCKTGSKEYALAARILEAARENRAMFVDEYHGNILTGFNYYAQKGHIELMATCATYAFLPHYIDMTEVINAQIEVGLRSHKEYFFEAPDGFWLPRMGYAPGLEKILRSYGLNYTILETHGVLFANPVPARGIFSPARCGNSLVVFARDRYSHTQVLGNEGFLSNPVYRNQNRDIAFEMDAQKLDCLFTPDDARISSGYKYWSNKNEIYNPEEARAQAKNDAREFLTEKQTRLTQAAECSPDDDALLMCTFYANVFGGIWHEGVAWLEEIFRRAEAERAQKPESLRLTSCLELLDNQFTLQKIEPYPSACSGAGYGEDLLDNSNAYLIRYVRKACERMLDLADRFADDRGLKMRTLNLAAKEALLAQSSDWARMLNRRFFGECADAKFQDFITAFSTVFDSLGSNSISTEWLTTYEKKHPIFPWLNYHVFSKKRN